MPIELAKIQLNRVHHVETLERASLVHHRVPGREGNLTQDLGRDSVRLQIEGIFFGAKAKDSLETLRKAYKQREPVDFLADVVGQAYFSQVLLERLEVVQSAQLPDQFSYRLTIAEYVPSKKSAAQNVAAVNNAVKTKAAALMNIASLTDALSMGSIPELTNPAEPLNAAVGEVVTALNAINAPVANLKDLLEMQAEVPVQSPSSLPASTPLKWVKQPSPEALFKAGLPLKNLIKAGASVKALLEAGASVLELRQAGVSAADLTKAGALSAALVDTESALKVLSQFWNL